MSTRPNECGLCGLDHPSATPCKPTRRMKGHVQHGAAGTPEDFSHWRVTTDTLTGKRFRWNHTVVYAGHTVPARTTARSATWLHPSRVRPALLAALNPPDPRAAWSRVAWSGTVASCAATLLQPASSTTTAHAMRPTRARSRYRAPRQWPSATSGRRAQRRRWASRAPTWRRRRCRTPAPSAARRPHTLRTGRCGRGLTVRGCARPATTSGTKSRSTHEALQRQAAL